MHFYTNVCEQPDVTYNAPSLILLYHVLDPKQSVETGFQCTDLLSIISHDVQNEIKHKCINDIVRIKRTYCTMFSNISLGKKILMVHVKT